MSKKIKFTVSHLRDIKPKINSHEKVSIDKKCDAPSVRCGVYGIVYGGRSMGCS